MTETELLPYEFHALEFLKNRGADCVGPIDTDEKIAAALTFSDLQRRGLVSSVTTDLGPEYSLSPEGAAVVDAWISRGRT